MEQLLRDFLRAASCPIWDGTHSFIDISKRQEMSCRSWATLRMIEKFGVGSTTGPVRAMWAAKSPSSWLDMITVWTQLLSWTTS